MNKSHRIHGRCRVSLEALELRLPPGSILFGSNLSLTGLDLDLSPRGEALAGVQLRVGGTWGDGTVGITGEVNENNSLVG